MTYHRQEIIVCYIINGSISYMLGNPCESSLCIAAFSLSLQISPEREGALSDAILIIDCTSMTFGRRLLLEAIWKHGFWLICLE